MVGKVCLILGLIIFLWGDGIEAQGFKFPDVSGWKRSREIQTFTPQTLFEYINGAADLYLTYNFIELKVAEYLNEKKASVIVEVYRHQTATHAFGIYSQERLPNSTFLNIGAQGYIEPNGLNFLLGSYYVKISSYRTGAEDQEILTTFAKKVSENLGEEGKLPSILSAFPQEGRKNHSEKFISKNFLGYPFLHSAFTVDYEVSGTKFKLFIIENDPKACRDMVQKYLEQTGKIEKRIEEGRRRILDPHHGEIHLHWRERYIWGTLNLADLNLRTRYLGLIEKELAKRK